jgi:hypothetical protein
MTVLTSSAMQANCFQGNTANRKTTIEGDVIARLVIARRHDEAKPTRNKIEAQVWSGFAEANSSSQHNLPS